ncbi:MAG: DUF1244 domain-containing protein [Novosphingobium sp.]|uniref:DUF1244 domain-containing protein n=1 Tax=Novosphingobium sp. TaxID=1874826 RepID=UPI0032B74BD5
MSCSENTNANPGEPLDALDDAVAAAAFRRLVRHLRHRHDAQNIDLMGLAGFCRNCLADWVAEASEDLPVQTDWVDARELIYGMPYAKWKERFVLPASKEQQERMAESLKLNVPEA